MPAYKAPVEDALFLLNDVFHIERYANLSAFSEATPDVVAAVLGTAARFCEEVLAPLNRLGDEESCRRGDDGQVTTPTGFKEAYRRYVGGGWIGVAVPPDHGGLGLPVAISQLISEFMVSANLAFAIYPTLTQGAIAALLLHGTAEQKALYVPKLASGEWTGTMNLTESHCGTDLGLIRTTARRHASRMAAIRITGTKIFISAGEHDLRRQHHPSRAKARDRRRALAGTSARSVAVRRAEDHPQSRLQLARCNATRCRLAARSSTRWAFTAESPPA